MKKSLMTVVLFALGASANAGAYLTCHNTPNQVPCTNTAWDVDGEALYFRNDSNAFIGRVNEGIANSATFRAEYGWGFRIEGSYHWGTGNDFTVNWSDYKKSTNNIDTLGGIFAAGNLYTMRSEFDLVNFEFGQHLDFGERIKIRLHAGIQATSLREFWDQQIGGLNTVVNTDGNRQSGWGPRVGGMGRYYLDYGFSFYGKAAVAILSMTQDLIGTANSAFWGVTQTIHNIIPEGEASFGLRYDAIYAQGTFTAKLAWEELVFINATFGNASLAWDGISFGLKWVGDN